MISMKNFCFVFSAISILFSCSDSNSIKLVKVEGSPEYQTSKLFLNTVVKSSDTLGTNDYFFNYSVENFCLVHIMNPLRIQIHIALYN